MRLRTARAILRTVVDQATQNPAYLQQLRESPVDCLVAEGLPYDLIEDFIRETSQEAEVSGYAVPDCANSCALTDPENYPPLFHRS
ncbi:MAG TPA: hypothetical protein VKR06_30925 [Ktedonosporobacter sp.]|nr:hypothetical protein [Ktedonosporobacter sp.]